MSTEGGHIDTKKLRKKMKVFVIDTKKLRKKMKVFQDEREKKMAHILRDPLNQYV